jgi:predicted nucleic acid-binding protein
VKVIDSSALIKYIAKEEGWEKVEEHLKEGCTTLDLVMKETANALVKKVLKKEASIETAKAIIDQLPRILKIMPQKEHFPKALEIAVKHKLTIYDALFIALSASADTPLLTSDRKQAKASEDYGVTTTLI